MTIKWNSNSYNGLFLLAFSIFFISLTPSQVPLYEASDALSPRLVPYIVLTLIGIFGLILIVTSQNNKENSDEKSETNDSNNEIDESRSWSDLAVFVGICLFITLLAEKIGFTFASIICLVIALKVFSVKKLHMILLIGIGLPILIDIGFRYLQIYLPLGFWGNIIY